MTKKNNLVLLVSIYLVAAFFAFAILRYFYVFVWTSYPRGEDALVTVRVIFSAPFLIALGILLLAKFKNRVHRTFGLIFLAGGIVWAIEIAKTIIEEGA